jgi:hypothetical protein
MAPAAGRSSRTSIECSSLCVEQSSLLFIGLTFMFDLGDDGLHDIAFAFTNGNRSRVRIGWRSDFCTSGLDPRRRH